MNRSHFFALLALTAVATVGFAVSTPACEPARVAVVKKAVVVEQVAVVQTVVPAVVLQPFVVTVPSYGVSYVPPPTVAADSPCQSAQLLAEVQQLRKELAAIRGGQPSPAQAKENVAAPQQQTRGQRGLLLLAQRCANCHAQGVSDTKGGKHAFFDTAGKLLNADRDAGVMLDALDKGTMPKGGAKLAGDDLASVIWALSVREDDSPPKQPQSPPAKP